jgi:hypothetical protein
LGSESAREKLPALKTHLENSLMVCRWKSCPPPALLNLALSRMRARFGLITGAGEGI